jgi:hypothetical protein
MEREEMEDGVVLFLSVPAPALYLVSMLIFCRRAWC